MQRAYEGLKDELETRGIKPPLVIRLPSTDDLSLRSSSVKPNRVNSRLAAELDY